MTSSGGTDAPSPGALALHPVVLVALGLWLVNDHVLKAAVGGPVPGKLSDVASLVAFPVLPFCLTELLFARVGRRAGVGHLAFWAAAAALVMVAINVSPAAADAYRWGLGGAQSLVRAALGGGFEWRPVVLTMDPTDAWTVPAAAIPMWLLGRQRRAAGVAGVAGAAAHSTRASTDAGCRTYSAAATTTSTAVAASGSAGPVTRKSAAPA